MIYETKMEDGWAGSSSRDLRSGMSLCASHPKQSAKGLSSLGWRSLLFHTVRIEDLTKSEIWFIVVGKYKTHFYP